MTLIFSINQAIECGKANIKLISPFVGRISDWYEKNNIIYINKENPGVDLVKNIFNYYKLNDITTEIMGASFRNINQILELSGCDLLTISPVLLNKLYKTNGSVNKKLDIKNLKKIKIRNSK